MCFSCGEKQNSKDIYFVYFLQKTMPRWLPLTTAVSWVRSKLLKRVMASVDHALNTGGATSARQHWTACGMETEVELYFYIIMFTISFDIFDQMVTHTQHKNI